MHGSPYSPFKIVHHPEKIAQMKAGDQPVPLQVQLIISDLCNENCSFCSYRMEGYTSNQLFAIVDPQTGARNNNPNRMIPESKVIEILDDCAEMGVKAIQLTGGGEPTVHPQHAEIFHAVLERGMDLALVTNGLILKPHAVDAMVRAKWVRFSLDAGSSETYSAMRGVSLGAFDRVMQNIARMVNARDQAGSDLVIGVGFVVTKENWQEVYRATRLARNLGVDNIRLSAIFQPDDERYFDGWFGDAARECSLAESVSTDRFRVFNNFGERLSDLRQHSPDYSFCGYQHLNTYIGADLNVYRCCVLSYNERGKIGSLEHERFKWLWDSAMKREKYEQFDARGCERCMFNNKNRTILYAISDQPAHVNFI